MTRMYCAARRLASGALAIVLIAAASHVGAESVNRILSIDVKSRGSEREIRIETSAEPTFTVFRLSDPMRVVVDVSGGDVSSLSSPMIVDDGVVSSVAARQFDANGFLIGRLTLGFASDVAYDVKAEGRAVVVRTAPSTAQLPRQTVIAPAAPPTRDSSQRVEALRREVEAARRNAEREREEAKRAKEHAAEQLAEARRIAAAAEESAKKAEHAQRSAEQLRLEAKDGAERNHRALEQKALDAERRLSELQKQAQSLATRRAQAEQAAADATRAEREASAAAARAHALHAQHVAEQQQLIATAKAERAKAQSEKEAAEAARIRAVAAKREAERARKQAEEQQKAAARAATDRERKRAEIDRREQKAQAALAELSQQKAVLYQEREQLKRDRDAIQRDRRELQQKKFELTEAQKKLEADRERLSTTQSQRQTQRRGSDELERLKTHMQRQKAELDAQRSKLAEEKSRLNEREATLSRREERLQVSTDDLIKQKREATLLASTSVPAVRGSLRGVESRDDGVLLKVDGHAPYELLRVEHPPRLVVRLDGVSRRTRRRNYKVSAPHVRSVRLGDHERATHAVFDLSSAQVEHSVRSTDDGVLIALAEGATAAASTTITDVRFESEGKRARIEIDADGELQAEVDDRSRRAWVLKLSDARIDKNMEQSLDTSSQSSVVRLLSTYQASEKPPTVNIVANLTGTASQTLRREGSRLVWELEGIGESSSSAPAFAREETRQSEGKAAAFRSTASAVSRSVTPTQTRRRRGGRRVTLDFKDADIINVIRLIADTTGENIIASEDVKGKVTVKLRNVAWERALDVILKSRGYDKVRAGGIIRIATAEAIQAEREREIAKRKAQEQVEETVIKIVTVNYATASDIVEQVKPLLSIRGSVQVDTRTNALIIEDVRSNINRLVDLTTVLDKQTPLVLIEARIVEANSNFEQEFGIQWGGTTQFTQANGNPTGLGFPSDVIVSGGADDPTINPTQGVSAPGRYAVNLPAPIGAGAGGGLGFIFGSAGSDQLLQLRLSALESSGSGRIISSPRVTTLDNKTAKIGQGVDIPITVVSAAGANTRLIPANLELEVTPHVTNDGSIVMQIKAAKNEPDFTNTGAQGDPSIVRNFAETEILVSDGETAVIGGIYTRSTARQVDQVPFLGSIPVLGFLFRNERETDDRSELLIFITPRIVNRDEALGPSASEMGITPG